MESGPGAILPADPNAPPGAPPPAPPSVTDRATRSIKWSTGMELVSRAAQPLLFIVLAGFLAPADFGVVATALTAISFAQIFWDAGLAKALVQTEQDPAQAADVVFWSNLALSVAVYGALVLLAPALADFFDSPASTDVLRVLGLQVPIVALGAVQQAMLVRELHFRRLFGVRLAGVLVPGLVSIALAAHGFGAWSLVIGTLIGATANSLLLWRASRWRPARRFDWTRARGLFAFGVWVFVEGLVGWFYVWGDSVIVGHYRGVDQLGVYRVSVALVAAIFGLLLNPLLPVLFPTYARLQGDRPALEQAFRRVNRLIVAVCLPAGAGLWLVGGDLAMAVFSDRYAGVTAILPWVGLAGGLAWVVGSYPEVYRAVGRPDVAVKIMLAALLYYAPVYVMSAQADLDVFVQARLALVAVTIPVHLMVIARILGFPLAYAWRDGRSALAATMLMAALVWGAGHGLEAAGVTRTGLRLVVLVPLGGIGYVLALWLIDRPFVAYVGRLLRRAASP